MKHVLVIPGDGIGPEVVLPTVDIISHIASSVEFEMANAGKEEFLRTGVSISEDLVERARKADAVFFGATTSVRDDMYRSPILTLRKELDLFANVRIAKNVANPARKIDIAIIRENTEGLYSGKEEKDELGVTTLRRVSVSACERITRFAFDWCRKNARRTLLCAHKANVLRLSDGLFLDVFNAEAARNPGLITCDALIDSVATRMVMAPEEFDTIVTLNLYGDILSDLAAGLIGGLGFMPSANIGSENALFEPAHGSAPDISGKGIANPIAALLSGVMMLDFLGLRKEADILSSAVEKTVSKSKELFDRNGRCDTLRIIKTIERNLSSKPE